MENVGQYITKYVKGKVPKLLFENPSNETLPYLSPDYLRGKANPEFYAEPSDRIVEIDNGEVIVLWDGSNAGEIFISKKGILGSTMVKLEFDENEIYKPYFSYSFQYLEYFLKAKTAGSGIPHADKGVIKKLDFFKPPKPEQTAIATILSKIDEAIEATQNSIKAAEKLKKALMQNLLTGKLKPDGTWRNDDEFYVDEKFGKVPKGWDVKRVKDCFDFYPTASYSRSQLVDSGEVRYIHYGDIHTKFDRILDLHKEELPFIPKELIKKYENLKNGDVVISDASEDWAGVGKCVEILNIEEKKIISGLHTLHLRPKSEDFILGIKGYIFNIYQVATNIKRLATGMKVYGISKPNLSRVLLSVPTIPEQKLIKDRLDFCSNDILQKQTKIQTLQRLKKSLMQNLLTGKLRLPERFIKQFEEAVEEMNNIGVAQ